jgi:hypothetical protein
LGHSQDFSYFRAHLGGVAVDRLLADQNQVGIRLGLADDGCKRQRRGPGVGACGTCGRSPDRPVGAKLRQRMRADWAWGGPMLTAMISVPG